MYRYYCVPSTTYTLPTATKFSFPELHAQRLQLARHLQNRGSATPCSLFLCCVHFFQSTDVFAAPWNEFLPVEQIKPEQIYGAWNFVCSGQSSPAIQNEKLTGKLHARLGLDNRNTPFA